MTESVLPQPGFLPTKVPIPQLLWVLTLNSSHTGLFLPPTSEVYLWLKDQLDHELRGLMVIMGGGGSQQLPELKQH